MGPPERSAPRPLRPRGASPAERGAEFAEIQRRLKREAAARRDEAATRTPKSARAKPRRDAR